MVTAVYILHSCLNSFVFILLSLVYIFPGTGVNAGAKMHRRAGVKMHHGGLPA